MVVMADGRRQALTDRTRRGRRERQAGRAERERERERAREKEKMVHDTTADRRGLGEARRGEAASSQKGSLARR